MKNGKRYFYFIQMHCSIVFVSKVFKMHQKICVVDAVVNFSNHILFLSKPYTRLYKIWKSIKWIEGFYIHFFSMISTFDVLLHLINNKCFHSSVVYSNCFFRQYKLALTIKWKFLRHCVSMVMHLLMKMKTGCCGNLNT